METFQEERLAKVPERFGEYVCSYFSDNKEVRADIFKRTSGLKAYITFLNGLRYRQVKDDWAGQLHVLAQELGYPRIAVLHFMQVL